MVLRVLQINLQHKKLASANLVRKLQAGNYDVVLIQEPWVVKGRVAGLANSLGKVLYSTNCTSESPPRTCLIINRRLKFLLLSEYCTRDLVAVRMKVACGELIVGSAYFPFDSTHPPPTEEADRLIQHASGMHQNFLLGVDANAHHIAWGSTDCNNRGEYLLEYIARHNLITLNEGNKPTFITATRREVLDITLSTVHVANFVNKWNVLEEPSLADHQFISFEIKFEHTVIPEIYRDPNRTDWEGYRESLKQMILPLSYPTSIEDLDEAAEDLQQIITDAYESHCPTRCKKSTRKTPWWNNDLMKMKSDIRKQFKQALRHNCWDSYHRMLTDYSKAIRKAKRASWRNKCSVVESTAVAARLRKTLEAPHSNPIGTIENPDGSYTTTAKETIERLIIFHFPDSVDSSTPDPTSQPRRTRRCDWNCAKAVVTPHSVRWAIGSFQPKKAPGPDRIFPRLLQEGLEILEPILTTIFTASVAMGYVPKAWVTANVVFLPKPGRASYAQAGAYRPICLHSFLLKSLEKILDKAIRKTLKVNSVLHANQFAYRPGMSTETALHVLVEKLEHALECKEIALCTFLDITGAFNNTSYDSMNRALSEAGVEPTICRWVAYMLQSRRVQTTLLDQTVEVRATRGCAQGGVLSPLLWNLVANKLLKILNGAGIYTQGYADDIVIVIAGKFMSTLTELMQRALKTVELWCLDENLTVNPSKTTIVPFTRKHGVLKERPPKLFGLDLVWSSEAKYLGVIIDRTLTWNAHIESKVNQSKSCMFACRRVIGKTWGLSPKITFWLFTAVIRPLISYAAVVWWPKVNQATVKTRLDSVQRMACIAITGAMSTTPTDALNVLLDLPALSAHIIGQARMCSLRLEQTGHWRHLQRGHSRISTVIVEEKMLMPSDYMVPEVDFNRPFHSVIPSREGWTEERLGIESGDTVWYTDGSKTTCGTGAGIYRCNPERAISIGLGKHCTVFQAEVCAIAECALENVNDQGEGVIYILTDSQAAVKALESYRTTSKMVRDCKQNLLRLAKGNQVTIAWCPGHSGHAGNEKADELARHGAETPLMGPEPACSISIGSVRTEVGRWLHKEQTKAWQAMPEHRSLKKLRILPSRKHTSHLLNLSRKEARRVVGLLTGHCALRHHLHRITVYQGSQLCRWCDMEDETADHVLLECEALARRRLQSLGLPGEELENIRKNPIGSIRKFIQEVKGLADIL